jgi:hypothetical protein
MRLAVFILAPIALAAISLFISPVAAVGQNRSAVESSRDVRREWSDLAKGRTEFEVSDPTLVPSQLALAVEQSGCRHYEELIKGAPIRFVVLRDRRFAIVLCSIGVAFNSHQLFDLTGSSNLEKPKLVQLPSFEQPDGFGTTSTPGGITWKSDTGVLVTEVGSDISFARLRQTYRLGYFSTSSLPPNHPRTIGGDSSNVWFSAPTNSSGVSDSRKRVVSARRALRA